MAAAAAALAMGIDREAVREGLRDFPGIPHRLELVADIGGVVFYNDSKATNVSAAAAALALLRRRRARDPRRPAQGGVLRAALEEPVREHCRACYLIGEAAVQIEAALEAAGVPLHRCASLEDAVRAAAEAAAARRGGAALAGLREL